MTSLVTTGTTGTITIDGNITTSGAQTYTGPVVLGGNATLTTTNTAITFDSTVNGDYALVADSGIAAIGFDGTVGGSTALASLATTGTTGTITLGGNVTTVGTQTYTGPVVLGASDTLVTTNSEVDFTGTVNATSNGGQSLTVNSGTGGTVFGSTIGATHTLLNLSLTGDTLSFGGNLKGTGTLTIQPYTTTGTNINIDGAQQRPVPDRHHADRHPERLDQRRHRQHVRHRHADGG